MMEAAPVDVIAVAVEGAPMPTMEANTVVPAIPVNREAMMAPVVADLVVKVGMRVRAIAVLLGMAALCTRRRLCSEHDTYQE